MARTLKTTGLATELVYLLAVDDDDVTLKEFVNGWSSAWNGSNAWTNNNVEMSVHNSVTVASGSWKGAALPYFQCGGSGGTTHSVKFNAAGTGRPTVDLITLGATWLTLLHTIDQASAFTKYMAKDGAERFLGGTPQKHSYSVEGGTGTGGTTISGGKRALGNTHQFNSTNLLLHGLESGSLAQDGTFADGGRGSDGTGVEEFGGWDGQGWCAPAAYFSMAFDRPLTLIEAQSIHADPLGVLFQSAGGGSNLLLKMMQMNQFNGGGL